MVAVHQRAVGGAKVGNTPGVRIFATDFSVGTAYVQIFNSDVAGKGAPHYDLRLSDGEGTVCGEVDKAGLLIGGALRNSFGGIELIKRSAERQRGSAVRQQALRCRLPLRFPLPGHLRPLRQCPS